MLAAAVDQEVGALPFLQVVLGPQPGPVEARVEATHPRRGADEPIDQSTRNTSCEINQGLIWQRYDELIPRQDLGVVCIARRSCLVEIHVNTVAILTTNLEY